jgi:tryptophan synthase beta chain
MGNLNAYYGDFGGMFVPANLESKLNDLAEHFDKLRQDKKFNEELAFYYRNYIGRPTPLFHAKNLSELVGTKIYLKREDLTHTGAHKINNSIGQILLAKHMGATEIIAETGAGQHGVATATAAALFKMKCKVFMGAKDVARQMVNVHRMKMLGAEVVKVASGTQTLKDAVDGALEYYVNNDTAFYLLGSAVGPHPYPQIVAHFQSVIGKEARDQILEFEGRLPDSVFACIGGGSNAIGMFKGFVNDESVKLFGAEGGGLSDKIGETAATLTHGKPAIFQGAKSYCLIDEDGNPTTSYSISAGLDYPGIGAEHSFLKEIGRAKYVPVYDNEAVEAFNLLSREEGIVPAIESAHAVGLALKQLKGSSDELAIINVSGRGDKDVDRIEIV